MSGHGTVGSYRKGCRCEPCRDAKKRDKAEYLARKKLREAAGLPAVVGRPAIPLSRRRCGEYVTYCKGCRCIPCTTAWNEYQGHRREVRRDREFFV